MIKTSTGDIIENLEWKLSQAKQKIANLQQKLDTKREQLKDLEWSHRPLLHGALTRVPHCPVCKEPKGYGHASKCTLAQAMAYLEAMK